MVSPEANRASERNGGLRAFRKKMLNFVSVVLNLKYLAGKVWEEKERILCKGADLGLQCRNRAGEEGSPRRMVTREP